MKMNAFNAAFLLAHPDYARKLLRKPKVPKVIVMSIKPKYAKAIYEGRKHWEFRKAPPPLYERIYIYESAPVSKVTGWLMFSEAVTGIPLVVWDMVKTNRVFTKNLTGISYEDLVAYAGKKLVTALRVYEPTRCEHPISFDAKPPQNWGRFAYTTRPTNVPKTGEPTT